MADNLSSNSSNLPVFESLRKSDENGEFWLARELGSALDYSDYRNFTNVMRSAWAACKNSGQRPKDHFVGVTTKVGIGSGAVKDVADVRLTRYACYLIVQNGDPSKEIIAFGQTYFAVQTRIQEIRQMEEYNALETEDDRRLFLRKEMTEHNKYLMAAAKEAGVVDSLDYAIFQNYGYQGLYGGLDNKGIKQAKGLADNSNILDHMGSTELAANLFRATQTEGKLKKDRVKHKSVANKTHFEIGQKVRRTIMDIGGTMPEELPVAENIKKLEARAKKKLPPSQSTS